MNWISNVVRPRIRGLLAKRDTPENLWVKCPDSGEMVFHKDLEANQFVFPGSGYHQRINAQTRMRYVFDDEKWQPIELPAMPVDPLKFRDERRYSERLKAAKAKKRDFTVDWVHLKLNDQAQRTVLCKDPFRAVDERVEKLIESL